MPQPSLALELDAGHSAPIYVTARRSEVSPHTGRDLVVLEGDARATGTAMHELFAEQLDRHADTGFWSQATAAEPRRRWMVKRENYTISGDQYRYHLTLREAEELNLDALVLDDLELRPTRYHEEVRQDILHAEATVLVDDATRDQLRALMQADGGGGPYFPFVRRGINDAPVEMRFGMCGWSEHPEGTKYRLILVDRRYDALGESPHAHISDHDRMNRRRTLAFRAAMLDEVLAALVGKGLLSDAEVDALRERAKGRVWDVQHAFWRVPDADDLA